MRTRLNILTPLLAATFLGASAFAATPTTAQRAAPSPAGQQQAAPQQRAPQSVQVAYYQGDPLGGGRLLQTRSVSAQGGPQMGGGLFQNAPAGATYAVVTTPFGKRVVNLGDAQNRQPPAGGPGGMPPGQDQPGAPMNGPAGDRAPGGNGGPQDRQGVPNALGPALRGATAVTFYSANPLNGGRALQTIRLGTSAGTQDAALQQAARQAKFAVVERPGERLIVDLSAIPARPDAQTR